MKQASIRLKTGHVNDYFLKVLKNLKIKYSSKMTSATIKVVQRISPVDKLLEFDLGSLKLEIFLN